MKIAILGSNSHIAKGLIVNFIGIGSCSLDLFTRNKDKVKKFLHGQKLDSNVNCEIRDGYSRLYDLEFDAIINCIGAGTPNVLGRNYHEWFMLTEKYDNMCIQFLLRHPEAAYINFSSGAVYGRGLSRPVEDDSTVEFRVNHLSTKDYYSIARLNSEAKHRTFNDLKIFDIRIFSYFSRYIDIESGYFITELLKSIIEKRKFKTSENDILRDYIHPADLFLLIEKCLKAGKINSTYDAYSAGPVRKKEILDYFSKKHGLIYEISNDLTNTGPNGSADIYCSGHIKALELGYRPSFTSIEAIVQESKFILGEGLL